MFNTGSVLSRILALAAFILAAFAAGAIGSAATFENVRTWYPTIAKPSWTPPSWVFGPVWTCLYVAMGVAAWRAWRATVGRELRTVVGLYATQLLLNALWSILFFGLRRPGFALIEIVLLWGVLVVMLARFWRIDRAAGLLWAPYVAWVSFATALNGAIWWLNR